GTVVVQLGLDAESDRQIQLVQMPNVGSDLDNARFDPVARTVTFTSSNWNQAVRIGIEARDDFRREDPATAVLTVSKHASSTDTAYVFPNLRSGPGLLGIEVV